MAASDLYNVTPGFHITEGYKTIKAIQSGFALEHATDLFGLTTCAAAAVDDRPDAFGADGTPAGETPDGREIRKLSLDECCDILAENGAGDGSFAAVAAMPAWLAAVFVQALVTAANRYLPGLLDQLLNR